MLVPATKNQIIYPIIKLNFTSAYRTIENQGGTLFMFHMFGFHFVWFSKCTLLLQGMLTMTITFCLHFFLVSITFLIV